jgi:hypothetical protein
MHILNDSPPYTINVAPREKATTTEYTLTITDENLNETISTESTSNTSSGNYEQIVFEHIFKTEGFHYFTLSINDGVEVYRGKFFITNQTDFDKFNVNQGVYQQYDSNDNQYIYR